MGKYLSTFDTLADYEAATSELGYPNVSLIKADGSIIYVKNAPTPTHSICYEIIPETIASYTATTYDSVYSVTDAKWYMLNNLNQYEEYGVYDIVEDISSATTYEGKLGVVGTTEYQYSGGSWNDVGTYEDSTVTYEIDDTQPSPYERQELATTFKIPMSDVEALAEALEMVDFRINTEDESHLSIRLDIGGMREYRYDEGMELYEGTVTNDDEYFYLSLPSEAPQSIVIQSIEYWNPTPIHLIVGSSKQASVEYVEKEAPSYTIYNTVQEMEAVGCPNVGINEYAFVGNDLYKYFENEEWYRVEYTNPKMIALYENEDPLIVYNNNNGELTQGEAQGEAQATGASFITAYIGDNVTSIGNEAFSKCSSLTSIDIPSSVTTIGNGAFQVCSSLTSIDIPSSVTSIGNEAFYNCISLTSVGIPSSVTSIGNAAFNFCSSLTSIDIPSGVTSIGMQAFYYCNGLTSVTVNATTPPTLGKYVFDETNNCPIYVPCESVEAYKAATNWSSYADRITCVQPSFNGKWKATYFDSTVESAQCDSTSAITKGDVTVENIASFEIGDCVTSIGDELFYIDPDQAPLTSVTFGNNVTSIGHDAFTYCTGLTEVVLPDSVTSIGDSAFSFCFNLRSINIPSGVTSISRQAFFGCTSLTSVTIPNSVTSIGEGAFQVCSSLTSIDIPSGVTSIAMGAFVDCTSLTSVTVNATTPPTLGSDVFDETNNCPIYVPSASVETYKAASGWSDYASRIQAIP